MALIPSRALKTCYTTDQRLIEEGQTFVWSGDPEKYPDYLERLGDVETVDTIRKRNYANPEERNAAIMSALAQLDKSNDEHWTTEGQPRMDVVRALLEDDEITRADLRAVAPEVVRPEA